MRLRTTEQVAKATGAPYRQLLRWLDSGWFTPTAKGGTDRVYYWFSDADVWEIAWFEAIRHRFGQEEWPAVASAINEIREAGGALRFIAAVRPRDGNEAPLVYRAVGKTDIAELVEGGEVVFMLTAPPPVEATAGG